MTEVTWVDCTAWLKARSDLPCEKIQAKAACLPTTGTFNLLSKILATLRLSGAVWIEAGIASGCPRTCAPVIDSLRFRVCVSSPFAPLPVYCFFDRPVNLDLFTLYSSRASPWIAVATRRATSQGQPTNRLAGKSLLRINLKERPAFARANIGSRGQVPGSCNGLFSGGFPTGAQGLLPHLTQRTCFPLPFGPATQHLSPGRSGSSTAHLQLLESIKLRSLLQARELYFWFTLKIRLHNRRFLSCCGRSRSPLK